MFCRVHRCFCNLDLFIVCSVTPVCLLQELQSYRKKCSTATPAVVSCREIVPGLTKWSGGGLGRRLTKWSGRDRCHSGGFLLRIMPPSWHPVSACTRNGHSAGGQFINAATTAAGGPFNTATTTKQQAGSSSLRRRQRSRRNHSTLRQRPYVGGTAILCDEENWNRTRHRCGKYCCRRAILLAGTVALQ